MSRQVPVILIALEGRVDPAKPDSHPSAAPGRPYHAFLADGCEVQLLARVEGDPPGMAGPASSVGPALWPVPNVRGIRGMLRHPIAVWRAGWRACRDADLLVVPVPGFVTLPVWLAARLRRVPCVTHVVGDAAEVPRGIGAPGGGVVRWCYEWLAKYQVAKAHAAWYVTRQALQERYPHKGLSFGIPNIHLDPSWFREPSGKVEPETLRLVFVGSLEQRYKGMHVLLESLAQLPPTTAPWHLDAVGEGACRAEAMTQAESLGIADRITWHGAISRDAVRDVLHGGAVFVMPSLTEGMPRALLEAMAAGLACVASRVGGIPEILPEHAMVPPEDPSALAQVLAMLLSDAEVRRRWALECHRASLAFGPGPLAEARQQAVRALRHLIESAR